MATSQDPVLVITAGIVALAFLGLIGFVVWRLSVAAPRTMVRVLVALGGVLAEIAVIVGAFGAFGGPV
ncbi:hypothetical protein ACQPZF_41400 [Actinosynnema sp. CS-041913]|uniref:hypothetical protein n=1 Tax=Actinosynnema sp. CS-041913 TaxID=3239917 RepID=UPI003D90FBFB